MSLDEAVLLGNKRIQDNGLVKVITSIPTWQNTKLGQFKVILEREIQATEANY